jgi:hypothetical protein
MSGIQVFLKVAIASGRRALCKLADVRIASCAEPRTRRESGAGPLNTPTGNLQIRMVAGFAEVPEKKEILVAGA